MAPTPATVKLTWLGESLMVLSSRCGRYDAWAGRDGRLGRVFAGLL